jgi:endothelin-converting enzyme/putative endopeptidase
VTSLDRSTDACSDFYQFACGGWMKANPIPPDQAAWSRGAELAEQNRATLKSILHRAMASQAARNPIDQKLGDFYQSCTDEITIDKLGLAPLKTDLDRIGALKAKGELPELVAHLHAIGIGVLFSFSSAQDYKDPSSLIADADQGGLGLPERDYYFKDDAASVELRKKYLAHVQKMFELQGDVPASAASEARSVMELETALAKASLGVVARRDPKVVYHKMPLQELAGLTPSFDWQRYVKATGAPPVPSLNVDVPDFFKGLEEQLKALSLERWKTYLRWQLVHSSAPALSSPFVAENFAFFGKTLNGTKELRPRWKRCVDFADSALGEALGQRFVEETFGADGKERMAKMVAALEQSMRQDLESLPWMTEATKKQALVKLAAIANKIGYPDKWRDYSSVKIVPTEFAGNVSRATAFETERQLAKIGKPLDRGEWGMTPPTVDAYYNPQMNDINFPAGILQPPFFSRQNDDAMNFGGIGSVIGHEITHGFDDQGRQFAADGSLNDWWTEADGKEFDKRVSCISEQYGGYVAVDDVKVNGPLTLGENTADSGGVRIAYRALLQTLANDAERQRTDGFSPEQRFFLGWGQVWCQNRAPERARMLAQTDPHSPGRYRVNGVVSNMPEFQQAFACKAGSPMVRDNACRVW